MSPIGRIGVVGLGNMGWPMAACLRRAGFAVAGADARPGVAADFAAKEGGEAPATLADLAASCDAVITMLPTSAIVERVLFGPGDALAPALRPGSVVLEMTSGQPGATRALADRLARQGVTLIDAPVSGGVARARTGELAIMAGGDADTLARVRPVLDAMGASVMHCGPTGAGHAMKALNNLVSAGGFLIGVEALLIGAKFGLDPAVMTDVLNASTGMNNSTQKKFRQFVLSGAYNSGFGIDLMVKDLSIALEIGRDAKIATPFAALCRELWSAGAANLGAGADHTAQAAFAETVAGFRLPRPAND